MSRTQFSEIMEMLEGAYGSKFSVSDMSMATVWYECLSDLQFEWLRQAAIQWIQSNRFPPLIAELRELYFKMKGQSEWQ